ncbi:hypothetical protein [Catellatospora sp. NPDC049609]|uniref:hypothetical protein n=1 Tax=Catellatospora sp. NPDC049609 TaxID=3155505 RepID=UPI00342D62B6
MERDRLIQLLSEDAGAFSYCRQALQAGANFRVFDAHPPVAANHFANVYAGRERRMRAAGTPTLGFPDAVQRLRDLGDQPLQLGEVGVASPAYHFQLFLTGDLSAVVACLGVDLHWLASRKPQQSDTV